MIPVVSLFYKIDLRLNKLSTNEHQQIPVENKVLIAREAVLKLIKRKLNPNNPLKVGFEGNKKRYQDLQSLVEMPEDHPLDLVEDDKILHRWTADLTQVKPDYLFYVDSYVLADKEDCKQRPIYVNNDLTPNTNITTLLNNSNYRPSFEYQETFCDLSTDVIGIYSDGSFTPTQLFLSYIRYPKPLDIEGYEDFEGNPSTNVDCELPLYLEDELLDIIIADIAQYTENIPAYQGASQSKLINE